MASAKRTLNQMANLLIDRVDKDREDTTFVTFAEDMLKVTLQEIISEVPQARWLMEENSITLVASQQYVVLPTDVDIDNIKSLRDDSNETPLFRIDASEADMIDPGRSLTGDALLWWYQVVGGEERMYFLHQPDTADTLYLISGEIITDPASGATCVLPAKYEWIWMEKTLPKIWERVNSGHDVSQHVLMGEKGMKIIKRDAVSLPGGAESLASHRPRLTTGVEGARFPSNFDVLS